MISPHLFQALVVADRTAQLRAEADRARLVRAATVQQRSGTASAATRSGIASGVGGSAITGPPVTIRRLSATSATPPRPC